MTMKKEEIKKTAMSIFNQLPKEDKAEFVGDVLDCFAKTFETGDTTLVEKSLVEWEATLELLRTPGLVEGVNDNFESLRLAGKIHK